MGALVEPMSEHPPARQQDASAREFLYDRINYERTRSVPYRSRRFKLDRMRSLLERLGHPERAFPAVHIAGTKGKGSTANMVASMLHAAGHRTGLYTSPHLSQIEERFIVNQSACRPEQLTRLLAEIRPIVLEMDDQQQDSGGGPTYFEMATATAFLFFQRQEVDVAVIEVGLGGRLDSTNVCHPIVSVITSISLDHTRQLGSTLAAIAAEKAGIIKQGVPVITGVRHSEPLDVIRRVAGDGQAPIAVLGRDFDFDYHPRPNVQSPVDPRQRPITSSLDFRLPLDGSEVDLREVELRLLGRHQAANAAVALATVHRLERQGWSLPNRAVREGLALTRCPARVECVATDPVTILDAAHNVASIQALVDTLDTHFPRHGGVLLFATSIDKKAREMLRLLLPRFDHVILTRYLNNPRAVDPLQLLSWSKETRSQMALEHCHLYSAPDPTDAWRNAQSLATPQSLLVVTGSFFLASEIREQLPVESAPTVG